MTATCSYGVVGCSPLTCNGHLSPTPVPSAKENTETVELLRELKKAAKTKELVNFIQWICYHGGEVELMVNGRSITKKQAEILVEAYLK